TMLGGAYRAEPRPTTRVWVKVPHSAGWETGWETRKRLSRAKISPPAPRRLLDSAASRPYRGAGTRPHRNPLARPSRCRAEVWMQDTGCAAKRCCRAPSHHACVNEGAV